MSRPMSYEKIIKSKPFTFLLGPERTVMTVHSGMVSHHSVPLEKLVDGEMSEARTGVATLKEVDPGTFARFSQWGYTGDYTAVDPEIMLDSSTIGTDRSEAEVKPDGPSYDDVPMMAPVEPESEQDVYVSSHRRLARRRAKKYGDGKWVSEPEPLANTEPLALKESAWLEFKRLSPEGSCAPSHNKAHINTEPREDYTEVFLCHARLYAFADGYDIEPLRKFSKQKIHRTLLDFNLYDERVGDIVALLRYVYANTPHRDNSRDELRELVMQYVVCQYDKVAPSEEFLDLMEEGGVCVRDCLSMLSGILK